MVINFASVHYLKKVCTAEPFCKLPSSRISSFPIIIESNAPGAVLK